MKNELLKNKIIDSIASKTVSDNLIYLSIAMLKHKNYIVVNNYSKKQSKYGENIEFLRKVAVNNGISEDIIGKKVNSIKIENYTNCISLNQALKISYICRDGNYTYDKNHLPDAVCGFVSDEEYASMLKDFGFSQEDNILKNDDDIIIDNTDKNKFSKKKDMFTKRHCEIIGTLISYIWDNKRVLLTRQVEEVFGMSQGMLLRRFYKFRENFELGKDYYLLNGMELKRFYELNNLESYAATTLYVWTQNGVSLFVQLSSSKKYLNLYQDMVHNYFEKKELIETYTPSINDIQITSELESNQQQSLNQPEQSESPKTPIEIALGIDKDGMTTARKLYEFLEMDESNYSRWCKKNITENPFAIENEDYFYSSSMTSEQKRGNFAQDFKLTANFAKKLSMQGKTERAEQAREYFTGLELKQFSELSKADALISTADLIVKDVDLFGDTVVAAQDKNGIVWAGVRWICDGLGLTKDQMKNERRKIQEDIVLSQGGRNLTLPTNGGNQDVLCLQLDYVPLWLAKISITPNMKKNNPELVEKLIKYQLKAKDVLAAAFLPEGYRIKPKKQQAKQCQTNNVKYYTSSTPIPKIKDSLGIVKVRKSNDWFYNNNYKIEKILDAFGWERSYLYHIILKTIGQEYDLKAAECIYEEELGISVEYAMDIVEYFNVLSQAATEILNKMVNGVINVN